MDKARLLRALQTRGYRDAWNKVADEEIEFPGEAAIKKHLELTRLILNGS